MLEPYLCLVRKKLMGVFRFDQVEDVVLQGREMDQDLYEFRVALVIPMETIYKNGYPLIPPFEEGSQMEIVAEKIKSILGKEQVMKVDVPLVV